jgi:hypothetical protein
MNPAEVRRSPSSNATERMRFPHQVIRLIDPVLESKTRPLLTRRLQPCVSKQGSDQD